MNRFALIALVAAVSVTGNSSWVEAGPAPFVDPPINLQALTPGTAQLGHGNITGQFIAGGLSATSNSLTGQAVYGYAAATSGVSYGGFFLNRSVSGRGVYGYALATSGPNYGGFFSTNSTAGRGVFGIAGAASGTGVGVFGKSVSPTGFGGYFEGNVHSTGIFSGNGSGLGALNASNIGSGTLSDLRLSSNVAKLDAPQTFLGANTFAAGLTIPTGAAAGKVLMSDANGLATWQPDGLALPYTGAADTTNTAFKVANSSTAVSNSNVAIEGVTAGPYGTGIIGKNSSSSGSGIGVYGSAVSLDGLGVMGVNTVGTGVRGDGKTGVGGFGSQYGVMAWAHYAQGNTYGLYAFNDGPDGVASFSLAGSNSHRGIGVKGRATSQSGINYGGWFESMSPDSRGLYAYVSSPTGFTYGAFGVADSDNGRGVYGYVGNGAGATYGVYGRHISPSGYGVYANGRTGGSGTKSFRIDHPFDPQNKYLLHYSSESPEPQNFYNGVVRTDAKGEAWVQLPDYFGEINKDFRYTLTVVDDTDSDRFVQAKIAREIRENRFKIRTSEGNVKVSWEVKAVRNDLWVRRYGAPVEEMKLGLERKTYQHPELYGPPIKDDREAPRPDRVPLSQKRR
ncbi:MAG: hypothetical protein IT363_15165 [Methanoregulaceae archaeon]|nr:hypothetical protein [Methanoregulaceae archaeon]